MSTAQPMPAPNPLPPDGASESNVPNTLADRYASPAMTAIFGPTGRLLRERELWIAVLRAQAELGLPIPPQAIADYEAAKGDIDLAWLRQRELETRHDEKAKIEAFNRAAGHEVLHLGMTSRDHSDNVDQAQIRDGLLVLRDKAVAALARMARLATHYDALVYAERTHLAPAQPSLIGKLFANFGEELLLAFERLEVLIARYPLRGLKVATGTQADQLQLFGGDAHKVAALEQRLADHLGFSRVLGSVGQIYPRSLDFEVASCLFQLACGPASFAQTARAMAGFEAMTEGFRAGQVGSTAMPHKMNARSSERIAALRSVLAGHVVMLMGVSGNQLYAGDVSDSAARRIAIPDAFYAADGLFETFLTVLDECGFYPAVIQRELDRYLPFLATSRLLMTLVRHGAGREVAHAAIREHAVAAARRMRETGSPDNDLLDQLSSDPRLAAPRAELAAALAEPKALTGNAAGQIAAFAAQIAAIVARHPRAAVYNPGPLL